MSDVFHLKFSGGNLSTIHQVALLSRAEIGGPGVGGLVAEEPHSGLLSVGRPLRDALSCPEAFLLFGLP